MSYLPAAFVAAVAGVGVLPPGRAADPPGPARRVEKLGRGGVALHQGEGKVFVSWRLLATGPDGVAFKVYRQVGDAAPVAVTPEPVTTVTHVTDTGVAFPAPVRYLVHAVTDGRAGEPGASPPLPAAAPARPYLAIPLRTLPGHTPGDASVGDLDGDGEYEVVVKQEQRPRDNSQKGETGETKPEAYKLDGTFLWRINLGRNVRGGAHYTQFLVFDLDGDGTAEVVCRTADGTTAGAGGVIGDAAASHRNADGYVLTGPEFLTVFDGLTGRALASADVGRGLAADIDPRHRGAEFWASGPGLTGVWNVRGEQVSAKKPRSCNFAIWWDGDLLRELLNGTTITRWNWVTETEGVLLVAVGCASNNGSKATPALSADVLGDWREEVLFRTADNRELRLYSTTVPTDVRLPTLMHDPQYRVAVAWQNVGYNQPPHPGFFLGAGMDPPPRGRVRVGRD